MLEMYAEKYANEIDEMVEAAVKETFGDLDVIKTMKPEELKLFKMALQTIDTRCKLVVKQAKLLDDMNRKLDKLLEGKES